MSWIKEFKQLQDYIERLETENYQIMENVKQMKHKYLRKKEEKSKLFELYNKLKHKFEDYIIEQQNQPSKANVQRSKTEMQDKTLSAKIIPFEKKSVFKQNSLREVHDEKLFDLSPIQNTNKVSKRLEIQLKMETLGSRSSNSNLRKS